MILAIVLGLLVAGAAPEPASRASQADDMETPLGSNVPRRVPRSYKASADAVKTLYAFSACLVKASPADVRGVLAEQPYSDAEKIVLTRLIGRPSSCLKDASKMRLHRVLLRGALAEASLKASGVPRPESTAATNAPSGEMVWTVSTGAADEALRTMTACFVKDRPDAVYDLLQTEPGSDPEVRKMEALSVQLGQCLPTGVRMTMNPLMFRAAFAEALYQDRASRPAMVAALEAAE